MMDPGAERKKVKAAADAFIGLCRKGRPAAVAIQISERMSEEKWFFFRRYKQLQRVKADYRLEEVDGLRFAIFHRV